MKKILFVNHAWNLYKTKSSLFLVDFLREKGFEVNIMPFGDEIFNSKTSFLNKIKNFLKRIKLKSQINSQNYDAIIFFQQIYKRKFILKLKCKNIIFVPMYDWYPHFNHNPFDKFIKNGIKILNFSLTLQQRILNIFNELKSAEKKQNAFSEILKTINGGGAFKIPLYTQYFLKPQPFHESSLKKVFFWQRREEINFALLKVLFKNYPIHLHIHYALDSGFDTFKADTHKIDDDLNILEIDQNDKDKFSITLSTWFENSEDMQKIMDTCGIYIAPRTSEGIGLSFLHALSLGKVIIAHNAPTMNEYITHDVNGYLFDYENPAPLDLSNIKQVQENARKLAHEGYQKWLSEREKIIKFIET